MLRKSLAVLLLLSAPAWGFEGNILFEAGVPLQGVPVGGDIASIQLRHSVAINDLTSLSLSGQWVRELHEPATNADLTRILDTQTEWRLRGGEPLGLFGMTGEIALTVMDPDKTGYIKMGQFYRPFGYISFASIAPPSAIAPYANPLSDRLARYQPSTLTFSRDIGAILVANQPTYSYTFGVLNGSGPDRLDNNGHKDWLLRFDYRPNDKAEIGLSFQHGNQPSFIRRDLGIHAQIDQGVIFKGEYIVAQRLGLDERRGWYVDLTDPLTNTYAQWSQTQDFTQSYLLNQVTLGFKRPLQDRLWAGGEISHFWETLRGQAYQSDRYLSALGVSF